MAKVDLNKDGKIELLEFTVLFEDLLARLELVAAAKKKFEELDVDKSGFLETPEIETLMKEVLSHYVEKSIEEREKFQVTLINKIDTNKDGKLDLNEFTKLWEEMMARLDLIENARKKFKLLDTDNSGFLEKPELAACLTEWAATCKSQTDIDVEAACTELIASVDVNGDGKLDLLEFVVIFETTMAKEGVWGKPTASETPAAASE
jgi:calmodulin